MTDVWIVEEMNYESPGEGVTRVFKSRQGAATAVREITEEWISYDSGVEEDAAELRAKLGVIDAEGGDSFIDPPGGEFWIGIYLTELEE